MPRRSSKKFSSRPRIKPCRAGLTMDWRGLRSGRTNCTKQDNCLSERPIAEGRRSLQRGRMCIWDRFRWLITTSKKQTSSSRLHSLPTAFQPWRSRRHRRGLKVLHQQEIKQNEIAFIRDGDFVRGSAAGGVSTAGRKAAKG